MSIPGTNIIDSIVPFTNFDNYPTHLAIYGKGGWRTVNSIAERDAIPSERREEGMVVHVLNDNNYQLVGGITNTHWQVLNISGSVGSVSKTYTQIGHGFSVGNVVYLNGSTWDLARADNENTLGIGIISSVNGNDFVVTFSGKIEGLSGLTPGEYYFTSSTISGGLTDVEPNTFSNPILLADSTSTGVVLPFRPSYNASLPKVATESNLIMNGSFLFHQREGSLNINYIADRWYLYPGTTHFNVIRDINNIPSTERVSNRKLVLQTTTVSTSDYATLDYTIEGIHAQKLRYSGFTLSFWVRGNVTGKYYVGVKFIDTSSNTYTISKSYTIDTINTWKKVVLSFAPSLNLTNLQFRTSETAFTLAFVLASQNTFYHATAENVYDTNIRYGMSDQVNLLSSTLNTFEISQVCLVPGIYDDVPYSYFSGSVSSEIFNLKRYCESNLPITEEPYTWNNSYFTNGSFYSEGVIFTKVNTPTNDAYYYVYYTNSKPEVTYNIYTRSDSYSPSHLTNSLTRLDTYTNVSGVSFENMGVNGFTILLPNSMGIPNYTPVLFHWLCEAELNRVA